ncbi:hypothetical protein F4811DRAFT_90829 [Daldinia bambusicola]|nr:hypothetical protein F4811DRAFT_90829 [Daldinia bambusicola]
MEHPEKPVDAVDLNELRKVFIDRVIPRDVEERLLSSEKLRRALLHLTTRDEVHRFIKNGQMSSRLRSRLLNEAPVTLLDKATSTSKLPESTVAPTNGCTTTPAKRVFTAKRTFPQQHSVFHSSSLTQKPIDWVGNQSVVSTTPTYPPTQSRPANAVSNVSQAPSRNTSLHNASKQSEDAKKSLEPTSQSSRPPATAFTPERVSQQLKPSPVLGKISGITTTTLEAANAEM